MTNADPKSKGHSGKKVVIALVTLILLGAGLWFAIEVQMPLLDSNQGKQFSVDFQKRCMTHFTEQKCETIGGTAHVTCYMKSAAQSPDGVVYDQALYNACIWAEAGMEAP